MRISNLFVLRLSRAEVEGHPACRPTAEARAKIHAVMVQTFGEDQAAEIKKIFDQCAHNHPGMTSTVKNHSNELQGTNKIFCYKQFAL